VCQIFVKAHVIYSGINDDCCTKTTDCCENGT
jgi:hypothetical protein